MHLHYDLADHEPKAGVAVAAEGSGGAEEKLSSPDQSAVLWCSREPAFVMTVPTEEKNLTITAPQDSEYCWLLEEAIQQANDTMSTKTRTDYPGYIQRNRTSRLLIRLANKPMEVDFPNYKEFMARRIGHLNFLISDVRCYGFNQFGTPSMDKKMYSLSLAIGAMDAAISVCGKAGKREARSCKESCQDLLFRLIEGLEPRDPPGITRAKEEREEEGGSVVQTEKKGFEEDVSTKQGVITISAPRETAYTIELIGYLEMHEDQELCSYQSQAYISAHIIKLIAQKPEDHSIERDKEIVAGQVIELEEISTKVKEGMICLQSWGLQEALKTLAAVIEALELAVELSGKSTRKRACRIIPDMKAHRHELWCAQQDIELSTPL